MDLGYFFKGMQNKETSASAWLATLLRHDRGFRSAFFDLIGVDHAHADSHTWEINVETELSGPCDVTLETEDTFVFVENKVSASARTENQFLRYYLGAARGARAAKRLVAVYLGPSVSTGLAERDRVVGDALFLDRVAAGRGDYAVCLGWKDHIGNLVDVATASDDWFARTGLEAILRHIEKLERGRPPNAQREFLRRLMRSVAQQVVASARHDGLSDTVRLDRWASVGEETLYTPSRAITTFLTLTFDEDEEEPYELHDVVVGDHIRLRRVTVAFNPSSKRGRQDRELMARWRSMIASGAVFVPGIGEVPAVNDTSFAIAAAFEGSSRVLEALLVERATAALAFAESAAAWTAVRAVDELR